MTMPSKWLYVIVAIMLLVAKEDVDGLRISDRIEARAEREHVVQ